MPPSALRRAVEEVAASAEPAARILTPLARVSSLAVVPGAYNPPTRAHVALAEAARARGFDAALFSIGTITIDKPAGGLAITERLQLLLDVAASGEGLGVVLHNRGLYSEQAEALRRALPDLGGLAFVVGMDKIEQIFDARYYEDFERSLAELFDRARLLVAARGDLDRAALERRLAPHPAHQFADRIEWLDLDPCWRPLSATAVRERLARGDIPTDWLPEAVERYLRSRGPIFTA